MFSSGNGAYLERNSMTLAMRFYWALALVALLAVYAPD
jgi:hypothetical protein